MNFNGKRVRIVNKRRFTLALFLLFISFLCAFMLMFNAVSGEEKIIYKDYVVVKGDTVWKIADINTGNDRDVREIVYEIVKVNNIKNQTIYPGQTIQVPIQE